MKNLAFALMAIISIIAFASCDDTETYAEQKDKENAAIAQFIKDQKITPITEEQFADQGYTTDTTTGKNQFVKMQHSGVYMQIVRSGNGTKLKDGETATILCRFNETNLLTNELQLSNMNQTYARYPEKMTITDDSGSFTASFIYDSDHLSLMYSAYNSTAVPSGWLVPFTYIKVGSVDDENKAYVRLIVPHNQGQSYAASSVYPCYYEITFQRGK